MNRITFFTCLLALFGANFQPALAQDATAKNKATIQAAYDALNRKDWVGFAAQCDPNFTDVNVGPAPAVGIEAALELYKQFHAAFPDFMVKINEIAPVSPTRFLLRVTVTGTNTGPIMGLPATGKSIKFDDSDVVELNAQGKITSHTITNTGEPLIQIGYAAMLNPSTQTVLAAYGAFGKGDIPGMLAMCADDVVWDVTDHALPGLEKTVYRGKAGVGRFFSDLDSKAKITRFEPRRFFADGDEVAVLLHVELTTTTDGKQYALAVVHHFTIRNGQVASMKAVSALKQL